MEKLTKEFIESSTADELDLSARNSLACFGCSQQKNKGLVLCWHCFKLTTIKVPYKNYYGDIKQWLNMFSYLNDK